MKLFFATFLASLAVAKGEQNPNTADELLDRWKLSDPSVEFNKDTNVFTFTYDPLHNDNEIEKMRFSFYDDRCKDDGTANFDGNEYNIEAEEIDPTGSGQKTENNHDWLDKRDDFPKKVDGYPQWEYDGSIKELVKDEKLYTSITNDNINELKTKFKGINDDDVGSGVLRFCVRFDIGFLVTVGEEEKFTDVNFRESIVQLKFDLTVGFTVQDFNVAPKERITTTTVKDSYELLGYLCPDTAVTESKEGRVVPKETTGAAFNQGALISVCVIPTQPAVDDGIIITSLTDYSWKRVDTNIIQEAIVGSQNSGNGLSLHRCDTPFHYCVIESILFAEFFERNGVVGGSGNAQLAFEARRLSDADAKAVRRKLEEEDSSAEFDLSVGVNAGSDGPGAIRTAGGASMGVTVVAALGALASAALLA